MSPVRRAGLIAAWAAIILPRLGEAFGHISHSEEDLSNLHLGPEASHRHPWIPYAKSYLAPDQVASWLELTAEAGTQTSWNEGSAGASNVRASRAHSDGSTQTNSDDTNGPGTYPSHTEAGGQTDDTSPGGHQDVGPADDHEATGGSGATEDEQSTPGDRGSHRHPGMHPVIRELSDKLRERHQAEMDDMATHPDEPPSPPTYRHPPAYSHPADTGHQDASQGASSPYPEDDPQEQSTPAESPSVDSQQQSPPAEPPADDSQHESSSGPPADDSAQHQRWTDEDASDSKSHPPGPAEDYPAAQGEGDGSYDDSHRQPTQDGTQDETQGSGGYSPPPTGGDGQPGGPSGGPEEEEAPPTIPTDPKGLTVGTAIGVLNDMAEKCNGRRLMDPLGMKAYGNDWLRALHAGKKGDKGVPEFDRLFYLGEATSLYYGSVLDEKESLRSNLKKKSESRFRRKRTKQAAVRQYAMTGLAAIAAPPQLDEVVIKALLEQLDFEECREISKISIYDANGKSRKVDVDDMRHRALSKLLGQTVRAATTSQDPVSAHNDEVLEHYVGSFGEYGAVASVLQQQTTVIPGRRPASPEIKERLVQYLQETTESVIYAWYMSFMLKLGSRFLKRAARGFTGGSTDPNSSILPPIPVSPDAIAWIEGVKVLARQTLFTGDPGAAKFDSALCREVMRHTLGSTTNKEEKALKKAQEKMDKEAEKQQKKEGGKKSPFSGLFRKKKGGDDQPPPNQGKKSFFSGLFKKKNKSGDDEPPPNQGKKSFFSGLFKKKNKSGDDEPSPNQGKKSFFSGLFKKRKKGGDDTPPSDQPPVDKKAEKARKKEEKKRAKEQKKKEKKAKKQQKEAEKSAGQRVKDWINDKRKENKDLERQEKEQRRQRKQEEKDQEKQRKELEKQKKKMEKEAEKEAKEEEKRRKKEEKRGGGSDSESQFLQLTSFTSSPTLLAIRPHNPWALEKNPLKSTVSFLQMKTRISTRTKTLIGISIAIVGAAGLIAAVVLGYPIVAVIIFMAIALAEFYIFI
ncbi:hypothetical protein ACSSS7_002868 [Eimeria intestinalis]